MFALMGIIALILYSSLVFYVSRSCWSWMREKTPSWFKYVYIGLIVLLSTSFILGRIGEDLVMFQILGAYWMAVFCLLFLVLPVVHVSLWLLRLTKLSRSTAKKGAGLVVLGTLLTAIAYGTFNAYSPVVREYRVEIQKPAPAAVEQLNIVMAADMHFGQLSGRQHAERLVEQINALEPDIVLFPGDIVDDDLRPYEEKGIDHILSSISARYGVYAALGNHDRYRGQMDHFINVLEQGNMTVLYDEAIMINDSFTLIGRKDRIDRERAPLSKLMEGIDNSKPLILLDHQPYDLDIAEQEGIDLMLSGHTHRGQIAPAHLITGLLFENDWGHVQKGSMHSIVTSGFGFWGPPIRIGSRSEIVQIHVTFSEE
ncbi:metallophosphoesterase [Paenibacillus lentus]|uniref:Metallophosphoesterase n=1 Tax=Paenibacillus lentus TaxID=1338368 RepID=A0A3Q8SCH6_9BACL|nr:metallophosphoesterase [Paenibacillus lentus]AZK47464.1 metallophosphoesterase [Paenibacillus lentus]